MTRASLLAAALLLQGALSFAATPSLDDEALRARLGHLEMELRCLVCQNQTLADSNAPLAEDLRREVRRLADAGKSDDEIRDYLVARYGDFVLYRPRLAPVTWLLWFGPFTLLAIGALAWWRTSRKRDGTMRDDDTAASIDEQGASDDALALQRGREALR